MEQRYYKQDMRRVSLRQAMRSRPTLLRFLSWVKLRMGPPRYTYGGWWLPTYFADIRAERHELTPAALERITPALAEFEQNQFRVASWVKKPPVLDPKILDGGGVWLLHETGDITGFIVYAHVAQAPPRTGMIQTLSLNVMCRLQPEGRIGVTNSRNRMDSLPGVKVVFVDTPHVATLVSVLRQEIAALQGRDPIHPIVTLEEMARDSDEHSTRRFQREIKRGFYVPMTEQEIAEARRNTPFA